MSFALTTTLEYGDDWFSVTGSQLHSDAIVRMVCKYRADDGPARFRFHDKEIIASVSNILSDNERGLTTIGCENIRIRQVEHILSALFGMGVLDTDIELSFTELKDEQDVIAPPVCHLGAREFCIAVLSSFHTRPPEGPRSPVFLEKSLIVREEKEEGSIAVFAPLHKLHVTTHIDFNNFLGKQIYSETITPLEYLKGICWARSFFSTPHPHSSEWENLRRTFPGVLREREEHFRSIMIDYDTDKWITPVLVNTEPVRHKLLDFLGDISLVGTPFNAAVYVYKPHHQFNRECAKRLAEIISSKLNMPDNQEGGVNA